MPSKVMVLPTLAQPPAQPRGRWESLANSLLSLHLAHPVWPRGSPYSAVPSRRRHGHLLAPRALGAEGKSQSGVAPAVFRGWMLTGCPGGLRAGRGDALQPGCPLASPRTLLLLCLSFRSPAVLVRAILPPLGARGSPRG